jgi:hypothetical protein
MIWKIMISVCLFLFVNILPYACRLYRGAQWAGQYLPDSEHLFIGLLFFQAFASIPAIPLILALWLGKRGQWALVFSFLATTVGLVAMHHDYDLASDAQAAIGLIAIPIFVAIVIETPAFLIGLAAQWLFQRKAAPGK